MQRHLLWIVLVGWLAVTSIYPPMCADADGGDAQIFSQWNADFCDPGSPAVPAQENIVTVPATHGHYLRHDRLELWVYQQGRKQATVSCDLTVRYKTIVDAAHLDENTYTDLACVFLRPDPFLNRYVDASGKLRDRKYAVKKITGVESAVVYNKKEQRFSIDIDLSAGSIAGAMLASGLGKSAGVPCCSEGMVLNLVLKAENRNGRIRVWLDKGHSRFLGRKNLWYTDRGVYEFFYSPVMAFMNVGQDHLAVPPCTQNMIDTADDRYCYHTPSATGPCAEKLRP